MARIAFAAPLTGAESVVGVPMMHAVELAVDETNAGGLPFPIELLAVDDGADPDRARALAGALVEAGEVLGVVGHKNSGPCTAAGAVYAAAGLAQITPSATSSDLAHRGWPTFFRVCADNDRQATAAAHFALHTLRARRVAAVHDGTAYGRPLAEAFLLAMEAGGADAVPAEPVHLGQRAFGETVRRLAGAECDLIYLGLTEIESASLCRALRAGGVGGLLMGADGGPGSPFPELAGEAAEGVYESYAGADPQAEPRAGAFLRAYAGRYGRVPIFGPEAYDAACLVLEAVRRAAVPRRDRVLAELRAIDGFCGVTGTISFEPDGNRRDAQVTLWRVVGGKMQQLSPAWVAHQVA